MKAPHAYELDGEWIIAMTLLSVVPNDKIELYCNLVERGKRSDVTMPIVYGNADGRFLECFRFPTRMLLPGNEEILKQITEHTNVAKFKPNYCKTNREDKRKNAEKNAARRERYKRKKEGRQ